MTASLFVPPRTVAINANSRVQPGAKRYFYLAGTNTPATVYSDAAKTSTRTQPVVATSAGEFPACYVDVAVKVSEYTSSDVLRWTEDNIPVTGVTPSAVLAALYPELAGEPTVTDFGWPPGDARRYCVLDGVTDDTAALQACADYCFSAAIPMTGAGTAKISATLALKCTGNLGALNVRAASSSVSPIVRVGTTTGATLQLNGALVLPKVTNTSKPSSGWASQGVGVELANLYQSVVTVPYVYGCAVGLDCGGYTSGFSYNTVTVAMLHDNKIGLRVQGKHATTGWANQNNFIGGRVFINSGEGSAISGARYIQLAPLATTSTGVDWPNGNNFIGFSVESNEPEYLVEIAGQYNQFIGCRFEATPAPVLLTGHATETETAQNQIIGGYNAGSIAFTKSGVCLYNAVYAGAIRSWGGSGVCLNLKNEGDGDSPLIQGFAATVTEQHLNAGTSATEWGVRLASTGLEGKEKGDVNARINLEFDTGKVHITDGAETAACGLANHADDAAAATGGIAIGQLYRNGSVVMIRVA